MNEQAIENLKTQRNSSMDAVAILLADRDVLSKKVEALEKNETELQHKISELNETLDRMCNSSLYEQSNSNC